MRLPSVGAVRRWILGLFFGTEAVWVLGMGSFLWLTSVGFAEIDGQDLPLVVVVGGYVAALVGAASLGLTAAMALGRLGRLARPLRLTALAGAAGIHLIGLLFFGDVFVDHLLHREEYRRLGFAWTDLLFSGFAMFALLVGCGFIASLAKREKVLAHARLPG